MYTFRNFLTKNFIYIIFLLYVIITAITIVHHEVWRDEMQAWAIARDAGSFKDIIRNSEYEGHPVLWFAILHLASKITHHYEIVQIAHLLLALATMALFLKYSPFSKLQKLLFSLGYFILYEYAIISRNYQIGILLFFAALIIYLRKPNQILLISLLVALQIQCNTYSILMAAGFSFLLFTEVLLKKMPVKHFMIYAAIILVSVVLAYIQMSPPQDSNYAVNYVKPYDAGRLKYAFQCFSTVFLPIQKAGIWNESYFEDSTLYNLSFYLLPLVFLIFRRDLRLALVYIVFIILVITASYFILPGTFRHHGHMYIFFIGLVWFYLQRRPDLNASISKPLAIFLLVIFSIQAFAGMCMTQTDLKEPFSQAKKCSEYIEKNIDKSTTFIAGYNDFAVSTIAIILDRPIYYTNSRSEGTFIVWDNKRLNSFEPEKNYIGIITKARIAHKKKILLILNTLPEKDLSAIIGKEKARFEGCTVGDENYYLFEKEF